MPASYQVVVQDTAGRIVDTFDRFIGLNYARRFNTKGSLSLVLPDVLFPGYIDRDYRILIYRSVDGRPAYLDMDTFWLVRQIQYNSDERIWTLDADDALSILERRIVGYRQSTLYADKTYEEHLTTFAADDMMKEYVRENLGDEAIIPGSGSPDTARDLSAYLTIEEDTSEGPQMEKQASYQNVLSVCQEIARTSAELGTNLYFDIIVNPDFSLLFKTWTTLRGANRGTRSNSPLIFYPDHNLEGLNVTWDYSKEISFIYAGGEDSGNERLIVTGEDTSRTALSPWNRIESFLDLRDMGEQADGSTPHMDDEISAALYGGRGRLRVTGSPIEIPGTQYGVDYFYGDVVQVQALGYVFDAPIDSVNVSIGDSGETIATQINGELIL